MHAAGRPMNHSTTPRTAVAWIASALIAMLPLSLAIEPRIKALVPASLFLFGLAALIRRADVRNSLRNAWLPFAAAAAFFAMAVFNVAWHRLGGRPLDQASHVLLYAVAAATFATGLRPGLVWVGFSSSGALLGSICFWQHHVLGVSRPYGLNGGHSAAIELAVVLIALSMLSLAQALNPAWRRSMRSFHGLCAALALYGALLTQSRGPLLALIPAWAVLLVPWLRQTTMKRRTLLALAAAALVAIAAVAAMSGALLKRFDAIQPQLHAFSEGRHVRGPVGERLEMWRIAWRSFGAHPVQGIGLHRFQSLIHDEIATGHAPAFIDRYNQPHNIYLYAAVSGGVPMLAALLAVLMAPLLQLMRHLHASDPHVASTARAGAAVAVLFIVGGLTAGLFYRIMPLSLFFFVTLGFSVWVEARRQRLAATD